MPGDEAVSETWDRLDRGIGRLWLTDTGADLSEADENELRSAVVVGRGRTRTLPDPEADRPK